MNHCFDNSGRCMGCGFDGYWFWEFMTNDMIPRNSDGTRSIPTCEVLEEDDEIWGNVSKILLEDPHPDKE